MRELVYYVAVSLDGRIAAPDGDYSAFDTEGDHMQLLFTEFVDALPTPALEALRLKPDGRRFDTVVMGWDTYAVGLPVGLVSPYAHLRQLVASRTARAVPAEVELTDAPLTRVRALKAEPTGADIWLCGGGRLAAALLPEIDRLVLKVNPVVLGDGIPLVAGGYAPDAFALTASRAFDSGVLVNEYRRTSRA